MHLSHTSKNQDSDSSFDSLPFHQLVPDCRKQILSYQFLEIETIADAENPPDSFRLSDFSSKTIPLLKFALKHFSCEATLDSDAEEDLLILSNLYSLHHTYDFRLSGLRISNHLKKLVELHIYDNGSFKDETIQRFKYLEVLSIAGVYGAKHLTDEMFTHLKHLRKLRVNGCHWFTDRGVENLYDAGGRLEELDIINCSGISDRAFSFIQGKSLRKLWICDCDRVNGEGIGCLRGVEHLELESMCLTSHAALKCLEGCAKTFSCFCCTLPPFDEKAMSYLKGILALEFVDTNIAYLTDAAFVNHKTLGKNMLWHLTGIHRLKLLETGIRIEAEDLPLLKRVFRNVCCCVVDWEFADEDTLEELRDFIEGQGGEFNLSEMETEM